MWNDKKKWFTSLENLIIVTPSQWLANFVKESYLGKYEIRVINNGIDLTKYNKVINKSKYLINVENKKIILGVASSWTKWKGLNDFYHLNDILDSNHYQIVLVGLNVNQLHEVPQGVIGIGRTNNISELVELYSYADVMVNPTYLDNYPTVNLESIACDTPVITYATGGSPESVDQSVGFVVEKGSVLKLKNAIEKINSKNNFKCREYALKNFDKNKKYQEYLKLYDQLYNITKNCSL